MEEFDNRTAFVGMDRWLTLSAQVVLCSVLGSMLLVSFLLLLVLSGISRSGPDTAPPSLPRILLLTSAVAILVGLPVSGIILRYRLKVRRNLERIALFAQRTSSEVNLLHKLCDGAAIMAVTDDKGRITWVNEAMVKTSGYSMDEMLGQDHRILNSGQHSTEFWAEMYRTVLAGQPWRAEVCNRRKDGALYWTDTTVVADLDEEGRPERFLTFRLDITELKKAITELSRLALAVDQVAESIVITDVSGTIVYVNPAFEQTTGYTREEMIGNRPSLLRSEKPDRAFYEALWSAMGAGRIWTGSFVNRRKDGTIYEEVGTIAPVKDESGRIVNFVAITRDVTDELDLEAQLRQAQKLESVGRLAAGVAHEINTPMQYIGDSARYLSRSFQEVLPVLDAAGRVATLLDGHAELADAGAEMARIIDAADVEFAQEEIPRAIDRVLGGVDRVSEIVRAMREFAHPSGKDKTAADLNHMLQSALTVSRNEYKLVAEIETRLSNLPPVLCHIGEMNQVFLNIIVNAAHAIGENRPETGELGRITVTTRMEPTWAVVEISDTGPGIPAEIRDKVFDPFFTTKGIGKGTGQGLAIARSVIVDKHGGQLTCRSSPGEGATFTIRLPLPGDGAVKMEEPHEAHSVR